MFNFIATPEADKVVEANSMGEIMNSWWVQGDIDSKGALKTVYEKCIEIGADAFMDFEIVPYSESYTTTTPVTLNGLKITGIAIKRDD